MNYVEVGVSNVALRQYLLKYRGENIYFIKGDLKKWERYSMNSLIYVLVLFIFHMVNALSSRPDVVDKFAFFQLTVV